MTLHERLEEIFGLVLGNESLRLEDDTTAADLDGWDSLAHINVMFSIEEAMGVQFVGDEFARLSTIGELKSALRAKGLGE